MVGWCFSISAITAKLSAKSFVKSLLAFSNVGPRFYWSYSVYGTKMVNHIISSVTRVTGGHFSWLYEMISLSAENIGCLMKNVNVGMCWTQTQTTSANLLKYKILQRWFSLAYFHVNYFVYIWLNLANWLDRLKTYLFPNCPKYKAVITLGLRLG